MLSPNSLKPKENKTQTDKRSWGKLTFMDNRTNAPCPAIDFKLDKVLGHLVYAMISPRKVEPGDPRGPFPA